MRNGAISTLKAEGEIDTVRNIRVVVCPKVWG
jgi:hypothetical protein